MKRNEIALLISSALSLVELIVRMRNQNPDMFDSEDSKLKKLNELTNEFKTRPLDYLQTWKPEGE